MGKLLCIEGEDRIELNGYMEDCGRQVLLLHYHGLAGNFYENKFVHHFIKEAHNYDVSFLSVNTRAHDHFSDAHFEGQSRLLRRGATHSNLREIRSDLEAWIRFARDQGFLSLILQGHSAGAVSIVNYLLNNSDDTEIDGVVFASPTDMVGLQLEIHGKSEFERLLQLARKNVTEQHSRSLMPDSVLDGYLFDSETYLDLFQPYGSGDIFDFRNSDGLVRLREIECPILCFFGSGEEVCSIPVANALTALELELSHSCEITTHVIDGSSHTYCGFEKTVTSLVLNWIRDM